MISQGMVVSLSGTSTRSFLACSTDLRMASGTSRAFPNPTPTWPWPSPTTTSAVNENRRPPLTTLATRLIATTRSVRSSALESIRASATQILLSKHVNARLFRFSPCGSSAPSRSELEPGGSRGFRESLDPPVVLVAAPVEDHLDDPALLGLLRHQLTDDLGGGDIAPDAQPLTELRRPAVHRRHRLAGDVVDELSVDVVEAPEHGQARAFGRPPDHPADPPMPDRPPLDLVARQHYFAPAFLPTLRRMCSSAYLMPLPLYGSGLRSPRRLAASWPRSALSGPLSVMETCLSTSAWTPSGSGKMTGWEYPSASWRFFPWTWARYPMPTISSLRSKPSLTPWTMFARSERIRPWSARTVRWSELRPTVRTFPSIVTDRPAGIDWASLPLGPSTFTVPSSTATLTPAGTGMGFLPIRHMVACS